MLILIFTLCFLECCICLFKSINLGQIEDKNLPEVLIPKKKNTEISLILHVNTRKHLLVPKPHCFVTIKFGKIDG